ncbi:hypothetical protein BJF79_12270 [Actinomadura sp. CNU-125]|nr:hypothetical protein BJF79_12270 [Actinomadura sp. CNU-125]
MPDGPPPCVPREAPEPIGSPDELAAEFVAQRRSRFVASPADIERFVAATVELAFRNPAGTRDALRRAAAEAAPRLADETARHSLGDDRLSLAVRAVLAPHDPDRSDAMRKSFLEGGTSTSRTVFRPPIERFLAWRGHEAAASVGRVPVLLATPTSFAGHIAPDVLVDRLERLQAAGVEPGEADLLQALLRIPRDIAPNAVTRAEAPTSRAGRTVAAALGSAGLPDPTVTCEIHDNHERRGNHETPGEHKTPGKHQTPDNHERPGEHERCDERGGRSKQEPHADHEPPAGQAEGEGAGAVGFGRRAVFVPRGAGPAAWSRRPPACGARSPQRERPRRC